MADDKPASRDRQADTDRGARGGRKEPAQTPPPWRTEGVPPSSENGGGGGPRWGRMVFWVLLAVIFGASFFTSVNTGGETPTTIAYTSFTQQVSSGNVKDVYARGSSIEGEVKKAQAVPGKKGETYTHFATERPAFAQDNILKEMTDKGVVVEAKPINEQRGVLASLLISLAPLLIFIGIWVAIIYWMRKRAGSGGLGGGLGGGMLGSLRRNPKPVEVGEQRVTFDDVAGIDEVEAELTEVVDFLKYPDKYRRLGAKVPAGVLLTGPPGTGKTLLARAVAGEANVPFYSAAASEFVEMVVGVGAARVRELFEEARKTAPSIIFIDEIDTIGRQRGGASLGGNDEREQTLNQILTEMDGFTGAEGVVVIAATNRPDVLDAALLRPGRFDRSVTVPPPDKAGRVAILEVHTRSVPLAPGVDLDSIAKSTPGMTGADLKNLVNEAALLAVKRTRNDVGPQEFIDALDRVQLGTKRALVIPADERRRTAYHESGHALLGMLCPGADPVRKITIVPHGRAMGVTVSTPDNDKYAYDENYLRGRITGALGGMAAEDVVFGLITTGAESDLEQVTNIARSMVGRWGMSERVGRLSILPADQAQAQGQFAAQETLDLVDGEARRIVEECYGQALSMLREHRDKLDSLAGTLLERETLDEADAYSAAGIARDFAPDDPRAIPVGSGGDTSMSTDHTQRDET
ncbi:MAG TPA: ATP-dependent zinc metalloprotease FtsH [Streptosporangiaceae bacterium]